MKDTAKIILEFPGFQKVQENVYEYKGGDNFLRITLKDEKAIIETHLDKKEMKYDDDFFIPTIKMFNVAEEKMVKIQDVKVKSGTTGSIVNATLYGGKRTRLLAFHEYFPWQHIHAIRTQDMRGILDWMEKEDFFFLNEWDVVKEEEKAKKFEGKLFNYNVEMKVKKNEN